MTDNETSAHFVYLYRDERGRPRYVGYGERPDRASSHLTGSHNPGLAEFVQRGKFSIEVAGPYDTEKIGRTVETALISALKPDLNVVQGSSLDRFRPLGVPPEFGLRLSMPPLCRGDFLVAQGSTPSPVIFVSVGTRDFGDGRVGYDLASPPRDEQILERVDRWWQLKSSIPSWISSPEDSPGLLVGIHGRPGAQFVIASVLIARDQWSGAEPFPYGEGKVRVPVLPTPNLDGFELRGRRIHRDAGIAFEGVAAGFFSILDRNGVLTGGRRDRGRQPTRDSA